MKRMSLVFLINLSISIGLEAQHNYDSQSTIYSQNGNVGIGTTTTHNGKLTVNTSSGTNLLRLENDGFGNESTLRFRSKSTSGAALHADISVFSTANNQGYLGIKVPANNSVNVGYDFILNHIGNIGLGTLTPFQSTNNKGIHISRGIHSSVIFGDPVNSGYGGVIQTSDSRHRVFIGANYYDDETGSWSNFQSGKGAAGISLYADQGSWGTSIDFLTSEGDGSIEKRLSILGNGNVGIGITNPDSKLVVDGKIRSEEVKVEIINGPDYVFEPDYELLTLKETKKFITENKHLPEIPSAKEMEANGIDLGDMNMQLLKKIEELTLYQIELLEKLEHQNEQIEELKTSNARIDELEKKLLEMASAEK